MQMLEYDPDKRITARQALTHEFFRGEPAQAASLSNGSGRVEELAVHAEKEPSASHAGPAEAAVLPKTGKPGSSQVLRSLKCLLPVLQTRRSLAIPIKLPDTPRLSVNIVDSSKCLRGWLRRAFPQTL